MVSQLPPVAYPIDPDGKRRKPIPYRKATLVPRHLAVGRWSLTAKLTDATLALAGDTGWRVVFDRGPMPGYGGPVDEIDIHLGDDSRTPMITLSGPDDMTLLDKVLAYPNPALSATAQDRSYDVRTGVGSTVILDYIARNVGHLALAGRPVPGFNTNITDPLIGGTVSGKTRFDKLLPEVVAPLAEKAGLRVWITSTTSGQRTLNIAQVADRTKTARFSIALRNLKSLKYRKTAPTANVIIGGGRGEETDRTFVIRDNPASIAAWRRMEEFYDYRSASDTDGNTELVEGADKRLAESAAVEQVDVVPIDTDRLTFGQDYGLGDKVLCEVGFGTGLKVPAIIREVEITVERGTGRTVTIQPKASTLNVLGTTKTDRALLGLIARVGRLERR